MKKHIRTRPLNQLQSILTASNQQIRTPEDELADIPEDTRSREEILQGCRKAIWVRLDRITKALIAQTLKKGSYLHARFLFDLVGVSRDEKEPREDGSLVQMLLEKLGAPADEKCPDRQHSSDEEKRSEPTLP